MRRLSRVQVNMFAVSAVKDVFRHMDLKNIRSGMRKREKTKKIVHPQTPPLQVVHRDEQQVKDHSFAVDSVRRVSIQERI